jgi:(p)ppGpp synthase/HD superfamily hydrolase
VHPQASVEWARAFALKKHADQKYGEFPYEKHLQDVYAIVNGMPNFGGYGPAILSAAWLHDVLEDTDATVLDLGALFGPEVALLVWNVTGVGKNRRERFASVARKIARDRDRAAVTLKLADRIANVQACIASGDSRLDMYLAEWPEFEEKLKPIGGNLTLWEMLRKLCK